MQSKLYCLLTALLWFANLNLVFAQSPAFVFSSSPSVGNIPEWVTTADVNGDGKVDLIAACVQGPLTVLTNDGLGGFVLSYSQWVGSAYSVCAADINGDGKLDLIAPSFEGDSVSVLTNDGQGGFVVASMPSVGRYPDSVCAADVNGDGKIDLIVANYGTNGIRSTLTVLTNDGLGGLVIASSPGVGIGPQCVVAADVNNDGKIDLVCANYYENSSVLTNDGSGNFALASSLPGTYESICVSAADVNNDGKVDFITPNNWGQNQSYSSSLTVVTNNGNGNFAVAASIIIPGISFLNELGMISDACAADVNGDGLTDLIYTSYLYDEQSQHSFGDTLNVLTNDGNGNFVLAASLSTNLAPSFLCAADINNDGKADLIGTISGKLVVFTNATIFSPPTFIPPLTIITSGAELRVSWPSASPGWSLQQNPDLITANWNPSGYNGFNISDDGTNKSLTLPMTQGNLFFRLLHP